jgi:hypothetical protein
LIELRGIKLRKDKVNKEMKLRKWDEGHEVG